MTAIAAPFVECEQVHAVLVVGDIRAAVDFYTSKLGFTLGFTWGDPPTFAGVNLGKVQMFLQQGTPEPKGCAVTFVVGDADLLHAFHRANGVEVVAAIADRDYGIRDYGVRDLNGYHLSFGHHLYNDGPPLPVERVDLTIRLERRLAALLQDLAAHRHTSVSSCVEEILLHTNDGVGPHTQTTLRHIQELKNKHGIDYDTHASYRFVEE